MKKSVKITILLLIFLLIFYLLIDKKNNNSFYKLDNFTINEKKSNDIYSYKITGYGITYNFELHNKADKIIQIKYYSDDDYKCILPIFTGNRIYKDIICNRNNIQYFYNTMDNKNYDLITFRNDNMNKYEDSEESDANDLLISYKANILDDKYLIVNSYKGIYILNNEWIKTINLFNSDVYDVGIKALVDKYYVVADYNQKYEFTNFNVIDILTGKNTIVRSSYNISFDTIVQGIYDSRLYIYDRENKTQYLIDPNSKTIKKIGNEKIGLKIFVGELKTIPLKEIDDFIFKEDSVLYKEKDGIYKFYEDSKTYLFNNNYDIIKYDNDYICMLKDNVLYCYDELNGIRKVVENKEFSFNKSITYYIYSK